MPIYKYPSGISQFINNLWTSGKWGMYAWTTPGEF